MIAFTVPLIAVILLTSQCINAYPSMDGKTNHPINPRLKRDYGVLQHHDLVNHFNEDVPFNYEENLPYLYSLIQRANRKRLIDF